MEHHGGSLISTGALNGQTWNADPRRTVASDRRHRQTYNSFKKLYQLVGCTRAFSEARRAFSDRTRLADA